MKRAHELEVGDENRPIPMLANRGEWVTSHGWQVFGFSTGSTTFVRTQLGKIETAFVSHEDYNRWAEERAFDLAVPVPDPED